MNKIIKYITLLTCVIGMSSCVKQKLEVEYTNQENKIDSYVTKTKKDTMTVSYNGGSTRLTLKQGTGEALEQNGAVSFYYAGYVFNGSITESNLFGTADTNADLPNGYTCLAEQGRKIKMTIPTDTQSDHYALKTRSYIDYDRQTGQASLAYYRFVDITASNRR
jgi:hypothetical protein